MLVRKNVWELGGKWADPILWYARAVGALKQKPIADRTSWRFWAGMHGYHQGLWEFYGYKAPAEQVPAQADFDEFWQQCQHGSWYFLPWHRGYLIGFEKLIRSTVVTLGGPPDWTLPYWNYFKPGQDGLPPAFGSPDWPDGTGNNPLFIEQRWGPGDPSQPGKVFVPLDAVNLDAMDVHEFTGVASGGDRGFGGIDTGFEHGGTKHGDIESQPHDQVHGLVGGEKMFPKVSQRPLPGLMSAPQTAGLDPIFWLHHANIDRLWSAWLRDVQEPHGNPGETTWLDGPADRAFVMPQIDQSEWTFTARDVLDTTAAPLDYSYDDESVPIVEGRATRRLNRLGARATVAGGAPESEAAVSSGKTPELIGASDGPVNVTGATGAAVRLDRASTQALRCNLESVASAAGPTAEPARVFLKLEGIRGTSDAANYHVYVGLPPNADPAAHRERLAGTVSLFGISAASDPNGPTAGSGVSQVLEITEIVDALHLSGADLDRLDVRFVPATAAVARANFSIRRLSVFTLGE